MKYKINWKARLKNLLFISMIASAVCTAVGLSPEMFTSWPLLGQAVIDLVSNPFRLGTAVWTILGIIMDPTTAGLGDSHRALGYQKPLKE